MGAELLQEVYFQAISVLQAHPTRALRHEHSSFMMSFVKWYFK